MSTPDFWGESRIIGGIVPPLLPDSGTVWSIVYGEAPGPRGADQSGVPFWGDGAGIPLYRGLVAAGCAELDDSVWGRWDGAELRRAGLWPRLIGVALSNAFPRCPTDDGKRFRAPKRGELFSAANLARLRDELGASLARGASKVITLGRCAAQTLEPLAGERGLKLIALPHPSSQGLLMSAPGKGRGMRLEDLRAQWQTRLVDALRS
jgi:uracil-DNA glycosylase